jgi:hypothetical protein
LIHDERVDGFMIMLLDRRGEQLYGKVLAVYYVHYMYYRTWQANLVKVPILKSAGLYNVAVKAG